MILVTHIPLLVVDPVRLFPRCASGDYLLRRIMAVARQDRLRMHTTISNYSAVVLFNIDFGQSHFVAEAIRLIPVAGRWLE
jgi:hypothetical protein